MKKQQLKKQILHKELQIKKLQENLNSSEVCNDLYNKLILEKAILNKELSDMSRNRVKERLLKLFSKREKLICDYF